jgi:hypothetical protein
MAPLLASKLYITDFIFLTFHISLFSIFIYAACWNFSKSQGLMDVPLGAS